MSFIFLSNTTVYQLTHISLCVIEFIGRTTPLHVSARGANFRRDINKPSTFYMDPYIISLIVCYDSLKKYSVFLSRSFNHLYMHTLYFILL
jgi:hypothetical protein